MKGLDVRELVGQEADEAIAKHFRPRGRRPTTGRYATREQAEAWAARQEHRKAGSGVTVGDMLEEYLEAVAGRTDTAKWNRLRIMKWLQDPLAERRLGAVTTFDINEWIDRRGGQGVGPATVRRELNLMSGAFSYAAKTRGWIKVNPCHGAQRPIAPRPRDRPLLTPSQIEAIKVATGYDRDPGLKTKTARVGACFLLALETGMRSGEILRLKVEDYWPEKRTAHVAAREAGGRKGSRSGRLDPSRHVPLTAEAMRLIDQMLPGEGGYIVGLTDAQRDALWRKAVKQAGLTDLHFHDTKHEAATRLSRFLDVLELSHAIGTKDIRLLRDTYYVADASRAAALLPSALTPGR
jgi:integrase